MKGLLKSKKGLTLLEILVTIVILSIIITPLLGMFLSAYKSNATSQRILSGTYITQAVLESCKTMDYAELAELSGVMQPYDSDGDGAADCYIRIDVFPEGPALSSAQNVTYLHMTYYASHVDEAGNIIDIVRILGDNGKYTSFQTNDGASLTLDWAGGNLVKLTDSTSGALLASFTAKSAEYPLVVIVNITRKTFGYNNTLTLTPNLKNQYNTTIVQYANITNINEFICSDLLDANRLFGVNDYSTALVRLKIIAYYDNAGISRLGALEESIKVKLG